MTTSVLLTGATGFVGRQVLAALSGHDVVARIIVRDGKTRPSFDSSIVRGVVGTPDLFAESAEWWADACKNIDLVIHLAWYAEPGKYLMSPLNLDCLAGTLNLARGAATAGVKRFVGIGSCFEYDLAAGLLSIDTPLRPLTPYAGAKCAAYMALSQWLPNQDVEFTWCRLFYLYGEGEHEQRLVAYLRARLANGQVAELTTGEQIRDFIDVREAGRRIAAVALGRAQGPVNICSGVPTSVREMAEKIADEYGRRDLLKFGARSENIVDPKFVVGVRNE